MNVLNAQLCQQSWFGYANPALGESHGENGYRHFNFQAHASLLEAHQMEDAAELWEAINAKDALHLLNKMAELPSIEGFTCILQKCRKSKDLSYARCVHTHVCKHGLEVQKVIGNYLVPMFVDCGSRFDSQKVFHKLGQRNEYSWTSLLQGLMDEGEFQSAFNLFEKMQEEHVHPSKFTFPALLSACAGSGCKRRGLELHVDIVREGFEGDLYISNALVDMYAKLGSFAEAQQILDEMSERDVVSWTALVTGYAEHGFAEEALFTLDQMRLEGLHPDEVTYVSCLKACGTTGDIEKVQSFHAEIAEDGLERDPFLGNTLVDLYASCGLLVEAQVVFDELPFQAVVPWTALISGYAEHGPRDKALSCLVQMQSARVHADAIAYARCLKACGIVGAKDMGQEIHAKLVMEGFDEASFVGSTLVDLYCKCGLIADARDMFDKLSDRDVVSWTALIDGYTEHGLGEKALSSFKEMQHTGISPNRVTYLSSLKACSSIRAILEGQDIHIEIVKKGLDSDSFIGNSLVDLYANCGLLIEARKVFDELPSQDIVTMNAIISGFAEQGNSKEAFLLYLQMQERGMSPDCFTFASVLEACKQSTALEIGKKIHSQLYKFDSFDTAGIIIPTVLLDMYGKCGSMADAQQVFDEMQKRELSHWTALITGYTRQGESEQVSHLLGRMKEEGVQPNEITFLSILGACNHAGLLDQALECFESMSKDYSIAPSNMHCNCMIDLFCRGGQLHEAVSMLDRMPLEPDLATWSTVLGACWKWGNVKLGRKVFEYAVSLHGEQAILFALMSNIYADAQMWKDAKKFGVMNSSLWAQEILDKIAL